MVVMSVVMIMAVFMFCFFMRVFMFMPFKRREVCACYHHDKRNQKGWCRHFFENHKRKPHTNKRRESIIRACTRRAEISLGENVEIYAHAIRDKT